MTTVLLVEDDPAIAQPLTRALQREGYRVRPAPTGRAAVAAFGENGADITLVILDLGSARPGRARGVPADPVVRQGRARC